MGSNDGRDDEKPVHTVSLKSFYMSATEITFTQYDKFCNATGRSKPGDNGWGRGNRPVINVSWDDAVTFCKWVSVQTGKTIRLPTEAEWEYAAWGGNKSRGCKYSGSNDLADVAWYSDNSGSKTHEVRLKQPNEIGLCDMSGNVWEWCADWYGSYTSDSQTNPIGPSSDSYRVIRGGSWLNYDNVCQLTGRLRSNPVGWSNNVGFRCARD